MLFSSMASAADSLRSKCGSKRGAPECSKQRSPGATPQVGQATEDNCLGVSSGILIRIKCDKTSRKTVSFGTLYKLHLCSFGDRQSLAELSKVISLVAIYQAACSACEACW